MDIPFIGALVIWNLVGFIIDIIWFALAEDLAPWDLCNPRYSYDYYCNVNWFGATVVSLIYTGFCPIMAIIYWFCVLCCIGREN